MHQAITEIGEVWGIAIPEGISEHDLLVALANRVAQIQAQNPEYFYQAMYRLDIPEDKLGTALQSPDAAHEVARLIWHRQWQKALSRRNNVGTEDIDNDLKW